LWTFRYEIYYLGIAITLRYFRESTVTLKLRHLATKLKTKHEPDFLLWTYSVSTAVTLRVGCSFGLEYEGKNWSVLDIACIMF
jgi:hypothetical protein